jgi:hypothetical protein
MNKTAESKDDTTCWLVRGATCPRSWCKEVSTSEVSTELVASPPRAT